MDRIGEERVDDSFEFAYAFVYILCNVAYDRFRYLQAVVLDLVPEDVFSQLHVRLLQFGHQSPFEARKQAFFHSLQHDRCAVGSQDKLFSRLMEMVKYMEECVLRFGNSRKFLDVIYYQNIYGLIKPDEIVEPIGAYGVCILHLKQVRRYIKHPLLGIKFLDACTNGVDEMCFTHSRRSVNEQRIESACRVLCNSFCHSSGEFIAVSFDEILKVAEAGCTVMVWCDDAYFGLNYEDNIEKQSLFARLAGLHKNILAVKIDGPTKEDYVWGFRSGFVTFGSKGCTEAHYEALTKKFMGAIRCSVSCCSTPSQSILLHAFKAPELEHEKDEMRTMLEHRYRKVRNFVSKKKGHPLLEPLPFNSGYFMALHCTGIDAEELRVKLLHEKGIGTIAIDSNTLRIAFSSIDENLIDEVYEAVYTTADELARSQEKNNL